MRKLQFAINLSHLQTIKKEIVPILFTEHQFHLLQKKFLQKQMTATERNEFSRSISRKMKAIAALIHEDTVFVYGKEKIIQKRVYIAKKIVKQLSRKFKNKHVLISGSFLYKNKYNDIDVFVISKYEKDDYKEGDFHINYLPEDVYGTLFFNSLRKLCISNRKIEFSETSEKANLDPFISLYQELFHDISNDSKGIKNILRDFLLQAAWFAKSPLPDSFALHYLVSKIQKLEKKKELIKKIFVQSVILGSFRKELIKSCKEMIASYKSLMKEYPQHQNYYKELIGAFKEVVFLSSLRSHKKY